MSGISTELLIVALLLLINGVFAMAEISIVSSRKARLKQLADDGDKRAQAALALANDPSRFLSTVQFGITVVGIVAGAFGGATLAEKFQVLLEGLPIPLLVAYAKPVSFGLTVAGITVATVLFGELVPKRIGLQNPEQIARLLAGPMNVVSRIGAPIVHTLTFLTELVLRPFGVTARPADAPVSDEELNILIEQGVTAGVFNKAEGAMVAGVLEMDQLPVTAIMTPRPKIVFLNLDDAEETNWRKIVASGHSHFPVFQNNRDHIVGMVAVKSIWANSAFGLTTNLKNLLVSPVIVPETMNTIQLLEQFKKTGQHIALVTDEFGAIQGLVTLIDVLEAIVGDLPERGRRETAERRQREDGSWLVDATLSTGELKTLLKFDELPHENDADFQTLGGFVMTHFGRIPRAGDYFDLNGWRFEVVDMDRHRIDKVLIGKPPAANQAAV